jgi:hypothetical protein
MRTEKDILTDKCYEMYRSEHGRDSMSFDDFITKTMSDVQFGKYFDRLWAQALKERSLEITKRINNGGL